MRRLHARVLALFALALLLCRARAATWSATDLPNPQSDPHGICGRGGLKSVVCDPDGFLSQSDADTLDGLSNFIHDGTHGFNKLACRGGGPDQGAQIAVAVVSAMHAGKGTKEERAYQFAKDVHDRWGVGDANCQNGIVMVFAVRDRAMGVSVGAGVKGLFKDEMVPAVMSAMKGKLREGEYGQAIVVGFTAIGNIVSGGKPPVVDTQSDSILPGLAIFGAILGFFGLNAHSQMRQRRRYRRCRETLEKVDDERKRANSNSYVATSCPICLEDFAGAGDEAGSGNGEAGATRGSAVESVEGGTASRGGKTGSEGVRVRTAGLKPTTAGRSADSDNARSSSESDLSTLPCGHKFHKQCILTWVSGAQHSNSQCPICRQPIDTREPEAVESQTNSGAPGGWEVYGPEYDFRMRRMHTFYPDYITLTMMESWHRDRRSEQMQMAQTPAFTQVDPVVVAAQARASGSGGSSYSFGGGSSAGGGGGGGGW